jgi:sugar lactone lactonase YvrE
MRLRILVILAFAIVAPLAVRAQTITTVIGGGPINLPKASASVGSPAAVRQDSAGNTYLLDNTYGRVYKVDQATGNMSVYAGNGITGFGGDSGPAVNAEMDGPSGMCMDKNDNLFIADSDNGVIREIPAVTGGGKTAGNIYTVVGVQSETDFIWGGDGGPATSANLHFPDGCSFDSNGNLYIADRANNEIRIVILGTPTAAFPTAGDIYLFAGSTGAVSPNPPAFGYAANGSPAIGAALNGPFDVFVDSHDNVFIADLFNPGSTPNNVIREVPATTVGAMTAGHIYTVAGVPGAPGTYSATPVVATAAFLNNPEGIFVDASGNIFFADSNNQVIREVAGSTPGTGMTAGFVYVVAGSGPASKGYAGDGGPAIDASLSFPAGTLVDSTGSIYIADQVSNAFRQVTSSTGNYTTETIDTFAGNGHFSYGGDGALAVDGQLNNPAGLAINSTGNLAIADWGNDLIRGVSAPISTGNLSTLAGEPEFNGFLGDGTPPPSVINNSLGVVFDPSGNLFIADTDNCIIREITGGNIITVAGTDPLVPDSTTPDAQCGFAGAGGPAKSAMIGNVNGVALDAAGDLFFSDSTNNIIWEVPKTTSGTMTAGNIYVVVGKQSLTGAYGGDGGPAAAAQLNFPTGIFFDIYGNLFIADTNNNIIREVAGQSVTNPNPMTAGDIYTVAGMQSLTGNYSGDGGLATSAQLNLPFTVVVDNADNIFIADTSNEAIREVTSSNGNINTVAGTPTVAGFGGDGGPAVDAELSSPEGLALDGAGDLLVGDFDNNRVRSISTLGSVGAVPVANFNPTSVTFLPQPLNIASNTQVVTLSNNGGAALTGIAVSIGGTNLGDFSQTNTCGGTLNPGLSCTITVTFKPTVVGARSAQVSVADNSLGSPQTVALSGNGITGNPADVLSPNPLTFATAQAVGVASTPQTITLSNMTGTAPLSIAVNGITIGGADAGDFSATNTCGVTASTGGTVAVGATCSINVTFKPTSATPLARTAAITLTDNAADSGQMVTLNGMVATAPAVTITAPTSGTLTFADQFMGTTSSSAQTINLTNSGTAALGITSIAPGGANPGDYAQTNTCGTSLAVGAKCTISVTFTPTTTGARPASIIITDNAPGSPQTITLAGNGFNINLAAASSSSLSQTVNPGQTATWALQFTTTGGASTDTVNVGLACSGAPALVTLACASTEPAPGTFSITAATTGSGMLAPPSQPAPKMQPPAALRNLPLTLLAVLLFIAAMLAWMQSPAGRMRTVRVALIACLVLLPMSATMLLTGCASSGGSSSTPPPPPTPSTAAGTYTITVTMTVSGAKPQTTSLTLIVQ